MVSKRVYLDNSATTAMAPEVLSAITPFLLSRYGNPSSIHFMGEEATFAVRKAREQVASSLKCYPSEITFTSGGTESDNLAILGAMPGTGRRKFVTTAIEHSAVLETCTELERRGFETVSIGVDEDGLLRMEDLAEAMDGDVGLVSVMAANNVIGTVQDIREAARIAHEHGALFHTDAVQAYGKMSLDVKADGIDLLSASGHKIHGPKGVGFLYHRSGIKVSPQVFGGGQEAGLRSSTENVPGIVGMGAAAELAVSSMEKDTAVMKKIRDSIIEGVLSIDGAYLNGSRSRRLCNNAHFGFEGVSGKDLVLRLSDKGIAASAESACSAGSSEPSHVLTAIGRSPPEAMSALRITISRYTTDKDATAFLEVLPGIIASLRS